MINFNFPNEVNTVFNTLYNNGYKGYLVGGCVRDILMGKTPDDYDFAVDCVPEETARIFSGFGVFETGLKHGTISVKINKYIFELTTFRTEGEYEDMRHPSSVSYTASLSEDLKRRDFTVNAMAYSPDEGIIDLFGGKDDIKQKVIKCVGTPDKRFSEDALRIMRALRFSSVLGFSLDSETKKSIHKLKELLSHISVERIYQELNKLIMGTPDTLFSNFSDVFSIVLPDFNYKASLDNLKKDRILRLALILNSSDSLKKLKADTETIKAVKETLDTANNYFTDINEFLFILGKLKYASYKTVIEYIKNTSSDENKLKFTEQAFKEIENGRCISLKDLKINGADLIDIGFKPGKELKETLEILLFEVISDKTKNNKEELIKRAIITGERNEI